MVVVKRVKFGSYMDNIANFLRSQSIHLANSALHKDSRDSVSQKRWSQRSDIMVVFSAP